MRSGCTGKRQQRDAGIPREQRVLVTVLNRANATTVSVLQPRKKTIAIMAFMAIMAATFGVALILENVLGLARASSSTCQRAISPITERRRRKRRDEWAVQTVAADSRRLPLSLGFAIGCFATVAAAAIVCSPGVDEARASPLRRWRRSRDAPLDPPLAEPRGDDRSRDPAHPDAQVHPAGESSFPARAIPSDRGPRRGGLADIATDRSAPQRSPNRTGAATWLLRGW